MPPALTAKLLNRICRTTGARRAVAGERIAELWSGYGEIRRVELEDGPLPSVVVKCVSPPNRPRHRRGWNTSRSHSRKLRSYDVEMAWYQGRARDCSAGCRVPEAYLCEGGGDRWMFVLEDLDAAGFPGRRTSAEARDIEACLEWLAEFHANHLGEKPEGLWKVGTYWHLATRPDELKAIAEPELRAAAGKLDAELNRCQHRTLVHGDAKLANFCFAAGGGKSAVAAVDFQYIGGGCGMKDVAYFLSSCLESAECEQHADALLDHYFRALRTALDRHRPGCDADAIEEDWRRLYPIAWADFYRFLAGWAPDHYKIHAYSRAMTERALRSL